MGKMKKHEIAPGRTSGQRLALRSFSETLKQARLDRGLSQADLAREIWGTTVDSRGYTVAKKRDRISSCEAGKAVPEDHHLQQLADALGMTIEELAPDLVAASVDRGAPEMAINMVKGGDNIVHLEINCLIDLPTAMEIGALITKSRAARSSTKQAG
jgi:transcriptional regulator with XRE-family HTH domain